MPRGEKLFKFLASLILGKFYGIVTIRMESGKVTHVEIESRRMWQYKDLPEQGPERSSMLRVDTEHEKAARKG